jgi:S-adenosylmethionine decarboxylase
LKAYSSVSLLSHEEARTAVPHSTLGEHILADLSHCNAELLASVNVIEEVLQAAVIKANANIIDSRFHRFSPMGVSGIILLSESHCSIHTWPEEAYAAIDIYTCGEHVHPAVACQYIASRLQAKETKTTTVSRGLRRLEADASFLHVVREQ